MTIPFAFNWIWVGSPLPDWARDNIDEWYRLHPKWGGVLWNEENMPRLMNQKIYDDAENLMPADAVGQFKADIARYEILHKHGGFYADVDTRPLRPIDDALSGHSEFAAAEDKSFIGNTYLACEPGSLVMLALIGGIAANLKDHPSSQSASVLTGPQYLTPIWKKLGGYVDTRTELFFPYNWRDVKKKQEHRVQISPDAYAVHEWAHTRSKMEKP